MRPWVPRRDDGGVWHTFRRAARDAHTAAQRAVAVLDDVSKEITAKYGVEARVLVVDFSDFDEAARGKVSKACKDLDVGILVNNVGISYPFPKYFTELTTDEVFSLMEMNVASTTYMTHIVLPGMSERKRGCVVNIAR